MSNKFKDIRIKNSTYYFFDDIINVKSFDPNKIKIDEKLYKNILTSYIGYVTIKDSKYVKTDSVNYLYLIINKVNGYFEEINGNKYLTLVPTNESKEIIKKYEELWSKIRNLIWSITKKSDDDNEKYMKIKFNSVDDLPLNKTIEIHYVIIVARAVFNENKKYYPQVFLINVCINYRLKRNKKFLCFTCIIDSC